MIRGKGLPLIQFHWPFRRVWLPLVDGLRILFIAPTAELRETIDHVGLTGSRSRVS